MQRAVLDTNILISAAISNDGNPAKIFEMLLEKKFINYTSQEILEEIEDVIKRPKFGISKEFQKFILDNFRKNSIIIKPVHNEKVAGDDDKFINCALSAKALVVSGDSHLLNLENYKGIKIITPKEFLELKEYN